MSIKVYTASVMVHWGGGGGGGLGEVFCVCLGQKAETPCIQRTLGI